MLPRGQAQVAGVGDHRAVVGAELGAGIVDLRPLLRGEGGQPFPQPLVGAHSARHHQPLQAGLFQCPAALDGQGIHDGVLKGAGNVGRRLAAVLAQGGQGEGLEAGEAEVEAGTVGHRAGKAETGRVALGRQPRQGRAAGIAQAEHLGGLVEGLAGGVVQRLAQQSVTANPVNPDQLSVAAGDQQGGKRELGSIGLQHRRQQMALHVMHPYGRHAPAEGEAAAEGGPHQQRPDQAGAGGEGDAADVAAPNPRLRHRLPQQRHHPAHMVARGQFRHHPAVLGMQRHLAVEDVRQQAAFAMVEGDTGLVAGGFDTEHE